MGHSTSALTLALMLAVSTAGLVPVRAATAVAETVVVQLDHPKSDDPSGVPCICRYGAEES